MTVFLALQKNANSIIWVLKVLESALIATLCYLFILPASPSVGRVDCLIHLFVLWYLRYLDFTYFSILSDISDGNRKKI